MRVAAVIAIVAAAGVGCGAGSSSTGNMPAPPPPSAATKLTISVWPQGRGSGPAQRYTLQCAPAKGTLPKPGTACLRLGKIAKPFAPPRKDVACTEQYGGPGQALVTGTFRGKPVRAEFALRNGCEIARVQAYTFLLPGLAAGAA